jgi:hypothetical protein
LEEAGNHPFESTVLECGAEGGGGEATRKIRMKTEMRVGFHGMNTTLDLYSFEDMFIPLSMDIEKVVP